MQIRVDDQAAFILHRREFQNSSLILDLFSEDYGRLSVLAKGARKRRDASHFQLFNRLSVGWTGRSELKTLTHIESRPLAVPTDCYMALMYINELLLYLLPKQDEYRDLFRHYQNLLLSMNMQQLDVLLREFEMQLLSQLGLMPDLSCESASGQALNSEQMYCFDVLAGVRACVNDDERQYPGAVLLAIQSQQFESPRIVQSARRLLRQIIDYNLQGRTLQSSKIYQQLRLK
jgi:DNA repair protein RecO (recombination protein O)